MQLRVTMDKPRMTRRELLASTSALATTAALAGTAAAQAPAPTPTPMKAPTAEPAPSRPKYRAAVMRLPIEVPISAAALEATRQRNAAAMVAAIDDAMKGPEPRPKVIVFPVLQYTSSRRAVSGVPMSAVAVDLISEPLQKSIFAPVVAACRRYDCYVATSTQEKIPQMPGTYFHTGFVMGPDGLVLRSPKSQAMSAPEVSFLRDIARDYERIFGPGSVLPVVDTPIGRIACYVEGEAEVLEASRLVASKGAEVILHTGLEDGEIPWLALKQAIGFQCHVFLLTGTTSRFAQSNKTESDWTTGASTIIGPDGKVLASIGERREGAAMADIDLNDIAVAKKKYGRNTVPAWGLYSELYQAR
jgi:predicted amidohydrolase